jgi:hypothetical protein
VAESGYRPFQRSAIELRLVDRVRIGKIIL